MSDREEARVIRGLIDEAIRASAAEIGTGPDHRLNCRRLPFERYSIEGVGPSARFERVAGERPFLNEEVLGGGWKKLSELPEVAVLVGRLQLLAAEAAKRNPFGPGEVSLAFGLTSVQWLLYAGLIELDIETLYETFLDELAESVARWLAGETSNFTASSLLVNFDAPGKDLIQLDRTTWLRRLGVRERMALAWGYESRIGHMDQLTIQEATGVAWAAETSCANQQLAGVAEVVLPADEYYRVLEDALSAIRLEIPGQVGLRNVTIWREPTKSPTTAMTWHAPQTFISPVHPLVRVSDIEIERTRSTWTRIKARIPKGESDSLRVAVSRFNDTYLHFRTEDRYLDCVICLEALFVPRREGETSVRFAQRGSLLLETEPSRRGVLFEGLLAAYRNRSGVTHGGKRLPNESAEELVALARRAITWFLYEPPSMTHEDLVARIDRFAVARQEGETFVSFLQRTAKSPPAGPVRAT